LKNWLIYAGLVVFFLGSFCIALHIKTRLTVAPPICDPISYYCKSKAVWDAMEHREYRNIMNVWSLRPPGTALILYPMGFNPSIKSFLFRATYAPVLIWGIALLILLVPLIRNRSDAWGATAISGALLSMPLFYHFELSKEFSDYYGDAFQWGMVDGLQASLAALAVALCYWGINKGSRLLCTVSWFVAVLTFFVKPSGILIIGCLFAISLSELFIMWRREPASRGLVVRLGLFSLLVGGVVTLASLLLALSTEYLGKQVVSNALVAAKVLIAMCDKPLWFYLKNLITPVIGIWALIPLTLMAIILATDLVNSIRRRCLSDDGIRFLVAMALLAGALYWWRYMAGIQTRYLFPFLLITIAWFVPSFFRGITKLNRTAWFLSICYLSTSALILIWLLFSPSEHRSIQKLMGYNLTVGQYEREVNAAKLLLTKAVNLGRPLNIYSLGDYSGWVIPMVDIVNSVEHEKPTGDFKIFRINDWIYPGIKMREVLLTDYFTTEGIRKIEPGYKGKIRNWQDEEQLMGNFIETAGADQCHGLERIPAGNVTLYKVVDRREFAKACRDWVKSVEWNDDFNERNIEARGDYDDPGLKVIETSEASRQIKKDRSIIRETEFGDQIKLKGVTKLDFRGSMLTFSFYFEALRQVDRDYAVFIHLLDANKKIIYQHDFMIDPMRGGISPETIWKSMVEIPKSEISASSYLGFGLYMPTKEGSFLVSDYKECDWAGRRVLIPLK